MKRAVAILVFDDVEVLDFTGPFEVFAVADALQGHTAFQTFLVAEGPSTVRARNGLKVVPDFTLENCPAVQVLVVPGGAGSRALLHQPALLEWVRVRARTAEHVMSVCTGALILAKAGLLDGLTVTTHHAALDELRALAPRSTVAPGPRFHDHGQILTSGGIAAGIDGSLHLVGRLLGPAAATATATHMEYPWPT